MPISNAPLSRPSANDLVIVAAMDQADPSLRFFAGLVDHIVLVAGALTALTKQGRLH